MQKRRPDDPRSRCHASGTCATCFHARFRRGFSADRLVDRCGAANTGIGLKAGFGNLKSEIGKIEAKERVPLVVGFADGGSRPTASSTDCSGAINASTRFGWVLGPPLRPDTQENQLRYSQTLKSHEVQVDLSLPAWWPSVMLSVRTAWADHWEKV